MKRVLFPLLSLGIFFGCNTEKALEPTTEIGLFTPFSIKPDYVKGMVKHLDFRSYWVTEQDGEFIMGTRMTLNDRDSIGWSYDFIAYYDSLGLAKKVRYLNDDEETYSQWDIQVEDGNYSKATISRNDIALSNWMYLYDEVGHNLRVEFYQPNSDKLLGRYECKLDDQGRWISIQLYNSEGEIDHSGSFEYNEAGHMDFYETENADGDVRSWMKYTYDENGLSLTNEGMESDSTMIDQEFRYTEFDEKGNWLKVLVYNHGELQRMDMRSIEFY